MKYETEKLKRKMSLWQKSYHLSFIILHFIIWSFFFVTRGIIENIFLQIRNHFPCKCHSDIFIGYLCSIVHNNPAYSFLFQYCYWKQMANAATLIQNKYRLYCEHKRFKKSQQAATCIQNYYRNYKEHQNQTRNRMYEEKESTPTTGIKYASFV